MHDLLNKRYAVSSAVTPAGANGPVDFNSTGDKYALTFPHPVDVYRWGIGTIALMDPDAGGFQVDLDVRPGIGSDTNRVNAAGGSIFRADADTIPAGSHVYVDVTLPVAQATGSDGSLVNVDPAGPLRVTEGQEIVFEVTNAVGAASTGYIWMEYVVLPFNKAGTTKMVLDT